MSSDASSTNDDQATPVLEIFKLTVSSQSKKEDFCQICEKSSETIPLVQCQGPCLGTYHLACIGMPQVTLESFTCDECTTGEKQLVAYLHPTEPLVARTFLVVFSDIVDGPCSKFNKSVWHFIQCLHQNVLLAHFSYWSCLYDVIGKANPKNIAL